ncbi:SDR family NAD(P)-dependent oxidoreductase [Luteibacter sp. NPDC031894]|uniref:SDR family NAD(P)-dependent oxidoreductase n=1 Tax=Luteibacter sp. NPDC031894 TaxID=3390572 RepID=UPI003CFC705B
MARFGRIDVWINDAGVGAIGPFERIPAVDHGRVVDTNLKGVIYGSLSALRQFKAQGRGTLVNIGSIDSEIPVAYQATYAATKAAVLSLGRSLNEEVRLTGQCGIHVVTIMPWAADTPWWRHAANYSGHMPRMAAIDGPGKVVGAIVHASLHPREEVPVGWKARAGYWGHRLAPDATERFAANVAHREQMEKAAPAADTAGAIHQPSEAGQGVEGGWREAIDTQDGKQNQEPGR